MSGPGRAAIVLTAVFCSTSAAFEKGDEVVVIVKPRTQADSHNGRPTSFKYGDPLLVREVRGDRLFVTYFGRHGMVSTAEVATPEEAFKVFCDAIEQQEAADNLVARGRAYNDRDELDRALDDFNRALELDPEHAYGYSNRAELHFRRGDYAEFYRDAETAGEYAPDDVDVLLVRAWARCSFEVTREAGFEDYAKILELQPDNYVALNNRAKILIDLGRSDEAFADLNRAIKVFPDYSDGYTNRGIIFHRRKQLDLAIRDATEAIRCNDKNPSAWNNRGNAYMEFKQFDDAIADFKQLTKIVPNGVEGYYGLANTNYLADRLDHALPPIERVLEISPTDYKAWNTKGNILKKQGKYEEALEAFNTGVHFVLQDIPGFEDPALGAAKQLMSGEGAQNAEALKFRNRTTLATIVGNRADAHRNLIGKSPDAADRMLADLDRAIALHPENLAYLTARGQQQYDLKRYEAALADFEAVLEQDPKLLDAIRGRILTLVELKRYDIVRREIGRFDKLEAPLDAQWIADFERRAAEETDPKPQSKPTSTP